MSPAFPAASPGAAEAARTSGPSQLRVDIGEHVVAIAWSPDGKALAAAGADGGVFLLDSSAPAAADGLPLRRIGTHRDGALSVAFSPDGARVASGGQDGRLRVFARHGEEPAHEIELPAAWVGQVAFSPDGRLLAVAAGRNVHLHDAGTLELRHAYAALPATVEALAFSPDGRQLAAASYGGVTLLTPHAPFGARKLAWTGACLALAWRPDASVIAAGGQDSSVQFWRLPKAKHAAMSGYATKVRELAWNGSGRWLATGGGSDVVLWDFRTGPEGRAPRTLGGHGERIVAFSWQRRGPLLASIARDSTLMLWHPGRGDAAIARYRLLSQPTVLAWSPDDGLLAIGGDGGELVVIEPERAAA